jgi:preprotein translocase subunit SecG
MSPLSILFGVLLFCTALFLILLVLVQRGRGGGLSGALGGMGGQSAFGTKAGDLFTRVTIVAATFWILLCITTILVLNRQTAPERPDSGANPDFETVEARGGADDQTDGGAADGGATGGGAGAIPAEQEPDGDQ